MHALAGWKYLCFDDSCQEAGAPLGDGGGGTRRRADGAEAASFSSSSFFDARAGAAARAGAGARSDRVRARARRRADGRLGRAVAPRHAGRLRHTRGESEWVPTPPGPHVRAATPHGVIYERTGSHIKRALAPGRRVGPRVPCALSAARRRLRVLGDARRLAVRTAVVVARVRIRPREPPLTCRVRLSCFVRGDSTRRARLRRRQQHGFLARDDASRPPAVAAGVRIRRDSPKGRAGGRLLATTTRCTPRRLARRPDAPSTRPRRPRAVPSFAAAASPPLPLVVCERVCVCVCVM